MEHNYQLEECSKSGSSEESDRSDQQANDDMGGTGRSYECVFCKRGFTTAQALGGHMNIHRKDRAKTRPSNSSRSGFPSRNNIDDGCGSYSGYPPMQGYQSCYPTHHEVQYSNSQTSYPVESTCGYRASYAQNDDDYYAGNSRHYGNQIGEVWGPRNGLSLQLGIGSSDIDDESTRKRDDDDESEVDLELRLGHQYYRRW